MARGVNIGNATCSALSMSDDDTRIDVTNEGELRYWSEKLGASKEELRRTVEQVGPKLKDVREHLFGGFTTAGPTS